MTAKSDNLSFLGGFMSKKIDSAVDIWKQSMIGRSPRDTKLNRPLLWAIEEMVKENYSLGKMAKRLGIAKRSIQRWKSDGGQEYGGLKWELFNLLNKPVLEVVDSEKPKEQASKYDDPNYGALFRAKRNREVDLAELAKESDIDRLIQLGAETWIYNPEGEGGNDFADPQAIIERWFGNESD
jgi:hypothetical protein